jgi:hemerythrin-like metal-binding protein
MAQLINPQDPRYQLGVPSMVETHDEFIDLVNRLGEAGDKAFVDLFNQLLKHTEEHFASENELMETYRFPPIQIHMGEHKRVLGELTQLGEEVASGATTIAAARSEVSEQIPAWFNEHIMTMDGALASHIKSLKAATEALDTDD